MNKEDRETFAAKDITDETQRIYKGLSDQSKLVVFISLIAFVNSIVLAFFSKNNKSFIKLIASHLMLIIAYLVMTYETNCLVKGNCRNYAWIVAIVFGIGHIGSAIHTFTKM